MAGYDYDLFVIGGGSGGVRAARIAAGHGARVGIAEEYRFGGTCVIRGCVPKKLMVYASRYSDDFADAEGFGWKVDSPQFDWPKLIAAKDKEIGRLEGLYRKGLEAAGVAVHAARAEFVDAHTLKLSDGSEVSADKILVATGGRPNIDPKLEGVEHAITSDDVFHLEKMPERVVISGGGYIAVEFAGIFNGLGAETTLVYRGDKILRGFDEDLRDAITAAYQERGIRIVTNRQFAKIEKIDSGYTGTLDNGGHLEADRIMLAIGRSPNIKGLGLEAIGVELGWQGDIVVNGDCQSSVENIFAVGDVTGGFELTPVAIRQGHAFADTQFGGKPWQVNNEFIPTAVFSTPEMGTVGLPEHEAVERCHRIDIYKSTFRPMRATLSGRDEKAVFKMIVDGESGKVVGLHVVGDDAAEIVQMAAVAMRMGATKDDFDRTMALHPSAAEELVTMREKTATREQQTS